MQSGHTKYYNSISVPIAIRCDAGKIYFGDSTTPAAEGIKAGWNTLVFDLNLTGDKATLSVNGGAGARSRKAQAQAEPVKTDNTP